MVGRGPAPSFPAVARASPLQLCSWGLSVALLYFRTQALTAGPGCPAHRGSKLTEPSLAQKGPRPWTSGWEEALRSSKRATKMTSADAPRCPDTSSEGPPLALRKKQQATFTVAALEAQAEAEAIRGVVGPEGKPHGPQSSPSPREKGPIPDCAGTITCPLYRQGTWGPRSPTCPQRGHQRGGRQDFRRCLLSPRVEGDGGAGVGWGLSEPLRYHPTKAKPLSWLQTPHRQI